jgi:hypothetical protein
MINILIRTSNRPIYFWDCVQSIKKQTCQDYRIIVGVDGLDTYADFYHPIRYPMLHSDKTYLKGAYTTMLHFPVNLYLNRLMGEVTEGWVMILDDDDMFATPDALEIIARNLTELSRVVYWKVDICGRVIPCEKNFGCRPVVKDISMIGFCFHSNFIPLLQFDPYKQSDYRVMDRAYSILKPIWIDKVLTKTQRNEGDGFGKRRDKDFGVRRNR